MHKDLMRRIEKLERESAQASQFQAKLRSWARGLDVPEEAFLRAVQSHEPELQRKLGDDGVTWQIFQLLYGIAGQLRQEGAAEAGLKARAVQTPG
jgi:hypothetical protein